MLLHLTSVIQFYTRFYHPYCIFFIQHLTLMMIGYLIVLKISQKVESITNCPIFLIFSQMIISLNLSHFNRTDFPKLLTIFCVFYALIHCRLQRYWSFLKWVHYLALDFDHFKSFSDQYYQFFSWWYYITFSHLLNMFLILYLKASYIFLYHLKFILFCFSMHYYNFVKDSMIKNLFYQTMSFTYITLKTILMKEIFLNLYFWCLLIQKSAGLLLFENILDFLPILYFYLQQIMIFVAKYQVREPCYNGFSLYQ